MTSVMASAAAVAEPPPALARSMGGGAAAVAPLGAEDVSHTLQCPLDTVQRFYTEALARGDEDPEAWQLACQAHFRALLEDPAVLEQVPCLNTTSLDLVRPNSLVRFRCMIQDMRDPEFYMGSYMHRDPLTGESREATTKYLDMLPATGELVCETAAGGQVLPEQRSAYVCVPVPGETEWAKNMGNGRPVDAVSSSAAEVVADTRAAQRGKRSAGDMDEEVLPVQEPSPPRGIGAGSADRAKRSSAGVCEPCDATATGGGGAAPVRSADSSPLGEDGTTCLVKVYEESDDLKLNQAIEFVGILAVTAADAFAPREDSHWLPDGVESMPGSRLPRLHSIFHTALGCANPVTAAGLETAASAEEIAHMRGMFIEAASLALGGDALAAEYLLLHCVSLVYGRAGEVCLGKFCLNLRGWDAATPVAGPGLPEAVNELMCTLLPRCHAMLVTTSNLNASQMCPVKDQELDRLRAGALQLVDHTHLLLDETTMEAGKLDTQGVSAFAALNELIKFAHVKYDFTYHEMVMPTDVPVLTITEAASLFPNDCMVPLALTEAPASALGELSEDALLKLRMYLHLVRESGRAHFDISEDASAHIEKDFVASRQADPRIGQEQFHLWLTLTRLACLSFGDAAVSEDRWNMVREMETVRMERLAAMEASAASAASAAPK